MILDESVSVCINYLNIEHLKLRGYQNLKINQRVTINICDLPENSGIKILVKCDMCGLIKQLSYQKYNKSFSNGNFYSCSSSCSKIKNRLTLKEKYGCENFNRSEENKLKKRQKYDNITEEIGRLGSITCSKCDNSFELSNFIKNVNGRYKKVCRDCRTKQIIQNRKNRDMTLYNKSYYSARIHIYAWRNLLKNYLNRKNIHKFDRTEKLLGYSHLDLKNHLELLFNSEMSWKNYGKKWQIDHIIPVSLFRDDAPVSIVNSLENLRPLDSKLNNIKKDKIDDVGLLLIEKYKTYLKDEDIKIKN